VKILILSDIHANLAALEAVRNTIDKDIDQIWCLGDIVNYGPQPRECLEVIKGMSHKTIRGNHDNAVGLGRDCGCSARYQALAHACKKFTQVSLDTEAKGFLSSLSLVEELELDGYRFILSHGSPKGDMYKYLSPELPESSFLAELEGLESDFVFLGHTHIPMIKRFGRTTLVNPGSVGQPRDGLPLASYALWVDGHVEIKRVEYDLNKTLSALKDMGLKDVDVDVLSRILKEGGL
jgi:putative phosphoesterase